MPEAAERSGLSQRAIRRALSEGRLPGSHYLGRWSVRESDLDAYARMARRHRAKGAEAPTAIGTVDSLAEAIEAALVPVLDRAVAAEARAAKAEATLALIESGASTAQEEADALRARVAELEAQLARRRRWWPWGSSVEAA